MPRSGDSTQWTGASFSSTWVRQMSVRADGSIGTVGKFNFLGQVVCFQAFCSLTAVSRNFFRRLCTAVQAEALASSATVQLNNLLIVSSPFCMNMLQNPWLKECSSRHPARKMARLTWTYRGCVIADQESCEMDD